MDGAFPPPSCNTRYSIATVLCKTRLVYQWHSRCLPARTMFGLAVAVERETGMLGELRGTNDQNRVAALKRRYRRSDHQRGPETGVLALIRYSAFRVIGSITPTTNRPKPLSQQRKAHRHAGGRQHCGVQSTSALAQGCRLCGWAGRQQTRPVANMVVKR